MTIPGTALPSMMHGSERARCAYGRGQRLGGGLGNSIGEVSAIRLMSRERLQAGPAGLAAGLRYIIAVGMPVTRHPPHRSVRADFPHTAPTSGVWRHSAYLCFLTHTPQPTRRRPPALCPGCGRLVRVPLGQRPSLHPSLEHCCSWFEDFRGTIPLSDSLVSYMVSVRPRPSSPGPDGQHEGLPGPVRWTYWHAEGL